MYRNDRCHNHQTSQPTVSQQSLSRVSSLCALFILYMIINVTRVVGDSGAVFTTETTRNSELKNAIFKIFALKLVELTSIKVLAKKSENKHGFQNFFCAFEMYENTDFCIQKIFLLRSFFDHFFHKKWIKKWPEPKKLLIPKISFFMPVNHEKEFLKSVHNEVLFWQLFARPLIEVSSTNFKAKILKMAFFNSEFLVVSMVNTAPEFPTTLVTLMYG